jgi:hypothetical protein
MPVPFAGSTRTWPHWTGAFERIAQHDRHVARLRLAHIREHALLLLLFRALRNVRIEHADADVEQLGLGHLDGCLGRRDAFHRSLVLHDATAEQHRSGRQRDRRRGPSTRARRRSRRALLVLPVLFPQPFTELGVRFLHGSFAQLPRHDVVILAVGYVCRDGRRSGATASATTTDSAAATA